MRLQPSCRRRWESDSLGRLFTEAGVLGVYQCYVFMQQRL